MIASTGVSWIDLAIGVLLLLYAISGFRSGIIVSASSLAGFLGGGALALWGLPRLLARWDGWSGIPALAQWGIMLVTILAAATAGQWLGLRIGNRLKSGVRSTSANAFDAIGGALLVLVTTALVLWFLGGAARMTGSPALSSLVGRSAILGAVDRVVPIPVGRALAGINGVMTGQGFPQVFGGVGREPITGVAAPDESVQAGTAITSARASVVRIDGEAPRCSSHLEGSGWVVAPEYVVTNAHVVSGTSSVEVRSPDEASSHSADVVLFDPGRDLAVLRVRGLSADPLPLGDDVGRGEDVVIAGYPLGGPYAVEPARVRDRLKARGLDIFGRSEVTREVYSLRAVVQPGNSGGPLMDAEGQVVGVVFARSMDDAQTGYALTLAEVSSDLALAIGATDPVGTGSCVKAG